MTKATLRQVKTENTLKRRTSCSALQGYVKTFLETAITIQQYAFFKYFDALPPSEIGGGRILTSTVVWGLLQREHPLYFERCCSSASIIPLYCCSNASIILWTWSEHHQPLCRSTQSQFCNFVAFFVPKVTSKPFLLKQILSKDSDFNCSTSGFWITLERFWQRVLTHVWILDFKNSSLF